MAETDDDRLARNLRETEARAATAREMQAARDRQEARVNAAAEAKRKADDAAQAAQEGK